LGAVKPRRPCPNFGGPEKGKRCVVAQHPLGKGGLRPPVASLPKSAVEQIGDHSPINRARDASLKYGAHELTECRIVHRFGEQCGTGDNLAAGKALAVAMRLPRLIELSAGSKL
jgi:hypothetical protein